jgi:WD40 repeat protein/serine/threonine protein kinase
MPSLTAVEAIFQAALEKGSPEERAAYLDRACQGDSALRQQVERLLNAQGQLGSFLEQPAAGGATGAAVAGQWIDPASLPRLTERPGTRLGPYKLLEPIGEGGMGTVWVAEQTEPIRRRVAVKVVKEGMDSRQVLARFEAERQALALMEHPNIARVLDAGNAPSGRPYFVMELVKGQPITRYCDDKRLGVRERLELFSDVCQAVQHAHQKGVIHRDLKPSNVLVAPYDGKPVVKVIDFGVAKATGQRLTDRTLFTGFGALVGTPEYMSPEQAEVNNQDIDTRSDIYALGVLLYELLTGSTPLTRRRIKEAALLEVLRVIRDEEPPRPSTRLSESTEALPSISAQRQTEPARLTALVRGELDWIVMKALEKDRSRRYETAGAFAADVQRYLRDEPVLAGPASAGYRLRKLVKRHRGPVLAAAALLLALVAGITGTAVGLVEAEEARQDEAEQRQAAVANAERAKDEAEKAKAAGEEARRLATEEKAARDRAETQLLRAEWLLYASQINLALQAWQGGDAFLAFHHLEACRRDFRAWEHDYLVTLFNNNQQTLRGHTGEVFAVAVSRDGKRIVSGSLDGTVKVWDPATGQNTRTLRRNTLPVNTGPVYSVALSTDGKRIVSGNWDTTGEALTVWDADTGQKTWALEGTLSGTLSVAFSPDGKQIASSHLDGAVKVWDAAAGKHIRTLRGPSVGSRPNIKGESKAVHGLTFTPDGKHVIGGDRDGTVTVWDVDTGKESRALKGHTGEVNSVAVSADGKRIVSGSADKTVVIWDADTGKAIRTFKGHTGSVAGVALSADAQRIISGSQDGTVKVWDAVTGEVLRTLVGHTAEVVGVTVSEDGQRIVSGSHDKTVKVWGAVTAAEPRAFQALPELASGVAVSADATRIVSGSADKTVRVWDLAPRRQERTLKGHTGAVTSVAVSPDGKRVVSGSMDQTVKVWDAATGREERTLKGHSGPVMAVAVNADGKGVLSVSADGEVKVWDAAGGAVTRTLQGYAGRPTPQSRVHVHLLALSPDLKHVLGGMNDGAVKVWNRATGENTLTLRGHTDAISSVAMSRDGGRIVTGSWDKTAKVWDAATGKELLTLKGHTYPVSSVAMMPNGRRTVTGSNEGTVKVWNTATGYETLTLKGPLNFVNSLAVSADGRRIVRPGVDGMVKVWEAGNGTASEPAAPARTAP